MTRRTEKVASLMHKEVAEFLLRLELPALTTISKVEVTPDLKWCKVAVTIMGDDEQKREVLQMLKENLGELQDLVNDRLEMKFVPKISFVQDLGEEYASHINELIRKTHEE